MFVTFEGIEGCGKTTQSRLLRQALESWGNQVTPTREPGGCPIADQMRAILLDAENAKITPLSELLLYAAARAQHVEEVIVPALDRGEIVLCDRYTDSTYAYQVYGRGLSEEVATTLNELATRGLKPDLTFLFDFSVEEGLSRARARIETTTGAREERFELEAKAFHERVRQGFLKLANGPEASRFRIIDASRSVAEIHEEVISIMKKELQKELTHGKNHSHIRQWGRGGRP